LIDVDESSSGNDSKAKAAIRLRNNRLHTSSMKKLIMESTDGGEYLKHEIAESYHRVKAVKHGMLIK
jgi:hypothetical protein